MNRYIPLSASTCALLKERKGRLAIDVLTKANQLVVSEYLYRELERRKPLMQSWDSFIRDLVDNRALNKKGTTND